MDDSDVDELEEELEENRALNALEEYQALTTLYEYHYRNIAVAESISTHGQDGPEAGFARLLTKEEENFLSNAIARLCKYMLLEETYQHPLPKGREPPNHYTVEELDLLMETAEANMATEVNMGSTVEAIAARQHAAIDAIERVMANLDTLALGLREYGVRAVHCDRNLWDAERGDPSPSKIVHEHIHAYLERSILRDNDWYPEGADPLREGEDERMWEHAVADPDYSYAFLCPDDAVSGALWSHAVRQATSDVDNNTYLSRTRVWSIQQLEELRVDTLEGYYLRTRGTQVKASLADAELDAVAADAVDVLRERARSANAEDRRFGAHNEWVPCYHDAVLRALSKRALPFLEQGGDATAFWRSRFDAEVASREGPANDLFAWRLTVLHLRMLRRMNKGVDAELVDRNVPITDGFDMPSLVQNVAHLIKYRRCVKWAKSIYKTTGLGSLHDQYRGKLLNREFAHAHQDESSTELGIARRMIRQAHVHNWYTHLSRYNADSSTHIAKFKWSFNQNTKQMENHTDPTDSSTYRIYKPEAYYTNPPMAPIMCSAPPRMGKSALSLLVASFAVKMGGSVHFGVAPNKHLPKEAMVAKRTALRWRSQGLPVESFHEYSEDLNNDIEETNAKLYELGSSTTAWVLHIRDEAQSVIKQERKIKLLVNEMTPVFYGLNMCVSATLLPVCMHVGLTGSAASVNDLLSTFVIRDWCHSDPTDTISRTALEKCVVKQPWSFPIGPDVLVPSKGFFPTAYPKDMNDENDGWYKEFYTEEGSIERLTNYYGTWFHLQEYRNGEVYLQTNDHMLIDDSLEHSISRLNQVKPKKDKEADSDKYRLEKAYSDYLKTFNETNRQYFNENTGAWNFDGPARVVNAPIESLTRDAVWMIQHAREWMDELPQKNLSNTGLLYPMLITAPRDRVQYKNGRLEWAILLCKIAWLRMYRDYVRGIIKRDTRPDDLARRYGLTVLVYTGYTNASDLQIYNDLVAKPEDVSIPNNSRLVAITFDPRLPENRFQNHYMTAKESDGTTPCYETGKLLPNALVPLLDAQAYADYMHELESDPGLAAADFLRGKGKGSQMTGKGGTRLRNNLYRFDAARCYKRGLPTPEDDPQPYPQGGDYGNAEPYDQPPDIGASAGGAEPMELVDREWDDAWTNGPEYPEERGGALPPGDDNRATDDAVIDCVPDADDPFQEDPPPLTDLNGIALRLCLTGFKNAQEAMRASLLNCNIVKVAAVGYQMFEAGLTLQSTFTTSNDAGAQQTHMFVPKYMSVAVPSEDYEVVDTQRVNRAPELSSLYQLIGRGFVDTRKTALPSNWKLNLLSQKGARKLCKLYGDAELLFSQIGNESVEGRKLTLGTALGEMPWRNSILDRRIKKAEVDKSTADTGRSDLEGLLCVVDDHSRPFRNLRYSLSGKKGHWAGPDFLDQLTPDDLLEEGSAVAHADVDVALRRMLDPLDSERSVPIWQLLGPRIFELESPFHGDLVLDENVELKRYEKVMSHGINVGTREERIGEQQGYMAEYQAKEEEKEAMEERAKTMPHPCANGESSNGNGNGNPPPVQGIHLRELGSDESSESGSESESDS